MQSNTSSLPVNSYRNIIILGGILLIGLTAAKGLTVYDVMRQQIEFTLGKGFNAALQSKAHFLESQIEKSLAVTQTLAHSSLLVQSVIKLRVQSDNAEARSDLVQKIDSLIDTNFSAVSVRDLEGDLLFQTGQLSNGDIKSLPLKYDSTILLWDDQFLIRTRKIVFDENGSSIGSVTIEKPLPQFTRSFNEIREIGETGGFVLCASPGQEEKISCFISQADGVQFRYLSRLTAEENLPMNYALEGKSGVMTIEDSRRVRVIEAYAPLSVIGLGMILKLDEEELLRPVSEKLKLVILYLAGLTIAEILLLNWIIRNLIKSKRKVRKAEANTKKFVNELRSKEVELHRHLKEITCLYEIRRSLNHELTIDKVCQKIFTHLIPALPCTDDVSVVIEVNGEQFSSRKREHYLSFELQSKIYVSDQECGRFSVYFPNNKCLTIKEEQRFIDAIVSDLESWLERKHLEQVLVLTTEKQLQTLGQELHDNISQRVAAIGYQVIALEKKLAVSGSDDMIKLADSIAQQAQTAVIETKRLARGLLPFELETKGLKTALQTLASTFSKTYDVECDFVGNCDISNKNIALNLYRVAQEAIHNAIRHGKAKQLKITLLARKKTYMLSVYDDGLGFNDNQNQKMQGMGVKIMQHRAKQLNAKLSFFSRPGSGTVMRFIFRIP